MGEDLTPKAPQPSELPSYADASEPASTPGLAVQHTASQPHGFHNETYPVSDEGRLDINMTQSQKHLSKALRAQLQAAIDDPVPPYQPPAEPILVPSSPDLTPHLNIVMQVVGSHGDIQPFLTLGTQLQQRGHRIRIATHPAFRTLVIAHDLEFFSIGGEPAELMAYMVRNPGLMPRLSSVFQGEVLRRRRAIRDMMRLCWKSCYEPVARTGTPFVADAIVANPPSFAHVHCAERLGIPLHMLFTYCWTF
jgi:hypothetical protein